jgi:dihydropteroate synthase
VSESPACEPWRIGVGRTQATEPWAIMGILNATPDSFSDGGALATVDDAVRVGNAMIEAGATILDVGAESTRPGAQRVSAEEQIRRAIPIIRALRAACGGRPDVAISIDTTLAAVAEAALDAGASIVNDVSAGEEDPDLLRVVAERACGVVLMHRVLAPERDRYSTEYAAPIIEGDLLRVVGDALLRRVDAAVASGVEPAAIAIDPGLGFGKTVEQNWAIVARSGELAALGRPLLVGASRKSFVGHATGVAAPNERVVGSAVAAAIAWAGGARIIRTHDVRATREALSAARAAIDAAQSAESALRHA